ncbi:hypothetical protein JQX13_39115 [Archangium violaceum]|uniref:hypothetical protein n=1 Tax=Archangium violaceum TaxID=83451 RepID=UPI00193B7719|nr:hypothetical protein [Archangium violaceum]QRK06087.1 hypothetical protein JQX13_39115 [Archangium violaceum]
MSTPQLHLDIESLVLPEGLVLHPEGFREALTAHLTRLLAERGPAALKLLSPGNPLRLESLTLSVPPGLDTERAAAHAAAQFLAHLTGESP